jgi:CheY-like chemotaxis protein
VYRVVVADSVRAALEHAGTPFDVVVSDVALPDGTGMDVMRGLLARGPVIGIALTGFGARGDVQATREAGFQRHLVKPIDLGRLVQTIADLLETPGFAAPG